jgi:hypothetical protein
MIFIAVILLALWALSVSVGYLLGGFIHLLLVTAIVLVAVRIILGNEPR